MVNEHADLGERDQRLQEVLLAYVEAAESGSPHDREQFLARHPEFAAELTEFFAGQDKFDGLAAPLRWVARAVLQATPIPGDTPFPGLADAGDPSSSPPTKTRSFGDYELLQELGRGGMGVVYKARQKSLNRLVALKMIRASRLASAADLQRFRAEAEAAASLDHPNIVPIYEVGTLEGQPYFSMKLVSGGNLEAVVRAQDLGSTREGCRTAAQLVAKVARAVHHAHQRGVLHRDLKPSNILLAGGSDRIHAVQSGSPDESGHCEPLVADFGLAKRLEGKASLTDTGAIVGTPTYMAPEQGVGKRGTVTTATDVYGLGNQLYVLLTGRPPFQGETPLETLAQVKEQQPEPLRRRNPQIDRDLETICLKCLEKEPQRRYPSAAALADDLERWLAGRPIQARPINRVAHFWRWCRRNRTLAGVGVLAVLALVTVVVLSTVWAFRERRNAKELATALQKSEENRLQAEYRLAENYLDRGLILCDQGDIGTGMLWLARSLQTAPAEAADLQWAIRVNLTGWSRQLHHLKAVLQHQGPVLAVAYSPDGQTVWTGSEDGTARRWQGDTGTPMGLPIVHPGGVRNLALSPDGQTLGTVSGDSDHRIVWTGPDAGHAYTSVLNRLAAPGTVRFWEAATGRSHGVFFPAGDQVFLLAFSPNGETLLTGGRHTALCLWHSGTGKPACACLRHPTPIMAAAFSPDGRTIVSGTEGGDKNPALASLWEVATGKPIGHCFEHPGQVWAAAFSPDGQTVLTGCTDGKARLWDLATGKLRTAPLQHGAAVAAVAWSRDGETLLTGSYDRTARLWQTDTGRPQGQPLPHVDQIQAVALSPDGRSVLTGSWEGSARLWEVAFGQSMGLRLELPGLLSLAFSPDGRLLATAGQMVQLWETATGKSIGPIFQHPAEISLVAFSPDGQTLMTACEDKLRLREVATGKLVSGPFSIGAPVNYLSVVIFSPDGRWLLPASRRNETRLWEVATGRPKDFRLLHADGVRCVAFSPDGRWIVTGSGKTAQVWDAATGSSVGEALVHRDLVLSVGFSPDGRMVLTNCLDGTAQRWDFATRNLEGRGFQSQGRVRGESRFGPDGRSSLMVSGDGQPRLGDTVTGRTLGPPLRHRGPMGLVAFGPDGKCILLRDPDERTLRMWEVPVPLEGEVERIICWTEVITGMELDAEGTVHVLDSATWHGRRGRLDELAGPPVGRARQDREDARLRHKARSENPVR